MSDDEYQTPDESEEEGAVGPDEFFDIDWDQVDRDDAMLEALGRGDVQVPDLADQVIADGLSGQRDDIRFTPLPEKLDPDTLIEKERTTRRPDIPAPASGGGNVSNDELAGQVLALGSSDELRAASAALSQADISLGNLAEQVANVLSSGESQGQILAAINQVRQGISDLTGPLTGIPATCEQVAARIRGI